MAKASLLDKTYQLLSETKLSYRQIALGSGVGFDWVKSFAIRRIDEPGVMKVQRVHDFLSSKHLDMHVGSGGRRKIRARVTENSGNVGNG